MKPSTLATILAMSLFSIMACAAESTGLEIGKPSPNLIGRTLEDKPYLLKRDVGKPKVVNFFWVNCIPCQEEMPELAKLEKQNPNVKFISVHTYPEAPENVEKFVKSLPGAPTNIVLTQGGMQETFKYAGLPYTLVLDKNNNVLMKLEGYTPENMRRLIVKLQELSSQ